MPYLRQRQKIAANGRVVIKLTTVQRDQLLASSLLPRGLGHLLHHAPVKQGKLYVRLKRRELDALILSAASLPTPSAAAKRALDVFLSYLEDQADRFEPDDPAEEKMSER